MIGHRSKIVNDSALVNGQRSKRAHFLKSLLPVSHIRLTQLPATQPPVLNLGWLFDIEYQEDAGNRCHPIPVFTASMPVKLSRVQLQRDASLLYSIAGVYRNAGGQECRVMRSCGGKDPRGSCCMGRGRAAPVAIWPVGRRRIYIGTRYFSLR